MIYLFNLFLVESIVPLDDAFLLMIKLIDIDRYSFDIYLIFKTFDKNNNPINDIGLTY